MGRENRAIDRDLRLAGRACAGDETAWQELVDRLGPRVFAVALHFVRDQARAEDLTQDVFVRMHQNLHKYSGKVPLASWTLRVARNLCIDHYRRHRLETAATLSSAEILEHLADVDDPAARAQRREVLEHAAEALEAMDAEVALIIRLRDLEGLRYEEIAALVDLPLGTVKSKLHRGRKLLFAALRRRWRPRATASDAKEPETGLEVAAC